MNEQQWLASGNVTEMLGWATCDGSGPGEGPNRRTLSERKLRLFACACCRQVWHLLSDQRSRNAVEVAERFADGTKMREVELNAVRLNAYQVSDSPLTRAASQCCQQQAGMAALAVTSCFRQMEGPASPARQADLLREVAGNPFRPAPIVTKGGRFCERTLWLTDQVLSLAQAAYGNRLGPRKCRPCAGHGFGDYGDGGYTHGARCVHCHGTGTVDDGSLDPVRLAVLADALEEAGCPPEECRQCYKGASIVSAFKVCYRCGGNGLSQDSILGHLRGPGPHVRGCWALDLILGEK